MILFPECGQKSQRPSLVNDKETLPPLNKFKRGEGDKNIVEL